MSKRTVELIVPTEGGVLLLHVTPGELKRLDSLDGAELDAMLQDLIEREMLYGSSTKAPRGILNT